MGGNHQWKFCTCTKYHGPPGWSRSLQGSESDRKSEGCEKCGSVSSNRRVEQWSPRVQATCAAVSLHAGAEQQTTMDDSNQPQFQHSLDDKQQRWKIACRSSCWRRTIWLDALRRQQPQVTKHFGRNEKSWLENWCWHRCHLRMCKWPLQLIYVWWKFYMLRH